jgi:hypothetical protein
VLLQVFNLPRGLQCSHPNNTRGQQCNSARRLLLLLLGRVGGGAASLHGRLGLQQGGTADGMQLFATHLDDILDSIFVQQRRMRRRASIEDN